jgi:hypothetical protein
MTINNDVEFKQVLQNLNPFEQRALAAQFVSHVLPFSQDDRLARVVALAAQPNVSQDELNQALRLAKAATLDSHARCGSEGNWSEQAGYFVARAAMAMLTPSDKVAWQTAMSCRMARTSALIGDESSVSTHDESAWQHQFLVAYLAQPA